MKIQFPKLFIACCAVGAVLCTKSYIDQAKQEKYQESVLKSYNLPADEYVKLHSRAKGEPAEFAKIADSLSIDSKFKQMFEAGKKSATDTSITLIKALKALKK